MSCANTTGCVAFEVDAQYDFCALLNTPAETAVYEDSDQFYIYDLGCLDPNAPVTSTTTSSQTTNTTSTCSTPVFDMSQCSTLTVTADSGNSEGSSSAFQQFFNGSGVETDPNTDSGNDNYNYPPIIAYFPNTYSACDAVQACLVQTFDNEGISMDLHFLASSCQWQCFQYYDYSSANDFHVSNSDVIQAYGYNEESE